MAQEIQIEVHVELALIKSRIDEPNQIMRENSTV
jgi:hypothetical protein